MDNILMETYRSVLPELSEVPEPIKAPAKAYIPRPRPKRMYSEKELFGLFEAEQKRKERR